MILDIKKKKAAGYVESRNTLIFDHSNERHSNGILFVLYKMVLTLNSVDEILV